MSFAATRMALALASVLGLALLQADDGCGTVPDPQKGEGEACIRTSECRSPLQCRGGACMRPGVDDAGPGMDAGDLDAGGLDAGGLDADVLDGSSEAGLDGDVPDAAGEAGVDAAGTDAASADAGSPDAG